MSIEEDYRKLMCQWHEETKYHSNFYFHFSNENFKKMIQMGESIIPFLLKDLEDLDKETGQPKYGFAFLVLGEIVGDPKWQGSPVDSGAFFGLDVMKTIDHWVAWGKENNYI